jgi:hypothetical protein
MIRVNYNQGDQRISVVPIHPDTGAPVVVDSGSDVTVQIVDLREHDEATAHTVLATTTVAQDSFSATLTATAGYSQSDPQLISASAGAAVVGRAYLLQDSSGKQEIVKLSSIGATSAQSVLPIRGIFPQGSTLTGVELSATFPSAEANDEDSVEDRGGPYLVTWTYVVGGRTIVLPTTLYVDRYSIAPPIDETFVLMAQPDMANRGRSQVSSAILVAWQDFLASAQSAGRDPSMLPPGHVVKVAVRKMALAYLNRWASGGEADLAYADTLENQARGMFGDILVGRAPHGQVELTRDDVDHIDQPKGHLFRLS